MTRLQAELNRLYLAPSASLVDAQGHVRALVLELTGPADWAALSRAWQGVQGELELPAPAIAVSGVDGLQLWFSLEQPVPAARAHAFLDALRLRFLPDVAVRRVLLMPAPDAAAPSRSLHAALVPALQEPTGNWSAFVAPDLAAVFSEQPWLDVEPGEEGQANLLRGVQSTKTEAFEAAWRRLLATAPTSADATHRAPDSAQAGDDPRRFLLRVMNDESVALALRIEAAKALLARD